MLHDRNSHKPSAELLSSFQDRFFNCFLNQPHEKTSHLRSTDDTHTKHQNTCNWNKVESTSGNNSAFYSGFMPDIFSCSNFSQALHADLEPDQLDHTDPLMVDHSGMAGAGQYGNGGQYSPKQLAQMEDSIADHPWANSGIETIPTMKKNSPLPRRDSGYERTKKSGDGIHLDGNENGKSFAKWQNEGFRFCAVLEAPTAMARNSDDPTLSYLNKGQAYKLSISDSKPPVLGGQAKRYRAFVRVAFDQEQSRSNPEACWQLWREARVMNRSHQKEGVPSAVEFAGPASSDFQCRIEQESFDGFCITWEADHATGFNICNTSLRFNFLSTDFTRAKGVKGASIRLCVKIQELAFPTKFLELEDPEICYCKIQLFRDHGAERKMSNDNGNLAKAIEKLKRKISSTTLGTISKKRKRSRASESIHEVIESMHAPQLEMQKPSNHEMNSKLIELNRLKISTQPKTILAFRGSKKDDPDLYPVHMPDEQQGKLYTEIFSANTLTTTSNDSGSEQSTPIDTDDCGGEKIGVYRITVNHTKCMKIKSSAVFTEQPPPFVACFYVRLVLKNPQQLYRAIYLSERTTRDLVLAISTKYGLTLTEGFNIFHVGHKGLKILVDDEFVQQIPEGQHISLQLDENATLDANGKICELRLLY